MNDYAKLNITSGSAGHEVATAVNALNATVETFADMSAITDADVKDLFVKYAAVQKVCTTIGQWG